MTQNNSAYPNSLDALVTLRGFACLMVLIAHSAAPRETLFLAGWDLSWLLFSAGGVAVRIFFCLSGYLMGKLFYTQKYTLNQTGILHFFANRALRVFPLYYFAVIVLSLFLYPHIFHPQNLQYLFRLLTFTYNQTLPVAFNGALWSISTEVQFYLTVPFIFALLNKRLLKPKSILQLSLLLLSTSIIIRYFGWQEIVARVPTFPQQLGEFAQHYYTPLIMNLDSFLCGFLLNPLILSQPLLPKHSLLTKAKQSLPDWISPHSHKTKSAAFLLIIGLYLLTAFVKYYNQPILLILGPAVSSIITCWFIFAFESGKQYQQSSKNEKLTWQACRRNPIRLLEIFGVLSYGMYVWHLPLIVAFTPIFNSPNLLQAYFQRLIATIITSMLIATLTYFCIEIPAGRFKLKRRLGC
ncbi:acyltransferase [Ancylothrix sp. C2]|uniref:acyltransferase family protein n=1 Tax=Ancylothrix sp. D3o TaxID=2953691 RepID=UPI0021BA5563|nr:acyltransferase [Ancylothrix sp. D3o]MCT7952608.1 acyltransferase [Ancylothrix sp. D3o]